MAVAVVQSNGAAAPTPGNVASTTLASNITAGNYLLVFSAYSSQSPNLATISDTLSQSYTLIGQINDGAQVGTLQAWYVKIAAGGACTVTNTTSASATTAFVYELSGADASLFFEGFGTDKNSGSTVQSTSAPVGAPSSFNGLAVLGVASWNNTNTFTYPSPLSQRAQFGDGTFSTPCYFADGVPGTTSPINLSAFISAGAPFATIGILVKEANGVFQGSAGGPYDDRYRFRRAQVTSHSSALIRHHSAWPEDTRDFGMRDKLSDGPGRIN